MGNKSNKAVKETEVNTDRVKEINSDTETSHKETAAEGTASGSLASLSQEKSKNVGASEGDPVAEINNTSTNAIGTLEIADANANTCEENDEPIIIIGGASEIVFESEPDDKDEVDAEKPLESEEQKSKEKSLRIIEGGGKEIIIGDTAGVNEKLSDTPACTRNKVKDKKIGDYGTYIAIAFFVVTIIISLFNIKGMRYPLSCLFLSFAAFSMGLTNVLRILNNRKCDCTTCRTQNKTFMYSSILWFVVFIGALIAFLVLFLK